MVSDWNNIKIIYVVYALTWWWSYVCWGKVVWAQRGFIIVKTHTGQARHYAFTYLAKKISILHVGNLRKFLINLLMLPGPGCGQVVSVASVSGDHGVMLRWVLVVPILHPHIWRLLANLVPIFGNKPANSPERVFFTVLLMIFGIPLIWHI